MNKKYYWLKLKKDFFEDTAIKKLRRFADGDTYTIIYLKMQLLSLADEGIIKFYGYEDTIAEEIALRIDEDTEKVQFLLDYLAKYKLIENTSDNNILLTNVKESIGAETEIADKMRKKRIQQHEQQKQIEDESRENHGDSNSEKESTNNVNNEINNVKNKINNVNNEINNVNDEINNVKKCYTEIEIEIEKDKDIERDIITKKSRSPKIKEDKKETQQIDYNGIITLYNNICTSLPKVTKITDTRKQKIRSAAKQLNGDFKGLFLRVESSDFLTGRNGAWGGCCFDWILKPANLIKIIEGNYDNSRNNTGKNRGGYEATYDLEDYENSSIFD